MTRADRRQFLRIGGLTSGIAAGLPRVEATGFAPDSYSLGGIVAFTIDRVPSGTNRFRLRVSGTDPASLQRRLASAHVMLAPPQNGAFLIGVNETLNRTTAADLTDTFVRALAD